MPKELEGIIRANEMEGGIDISNDTYIIIRPKQLAQAILDAGYIKKSDVMVDEERLAKEISEWGERTHLPRVCEDSGQAEWTVGESKSLAKAISQNIQELI